MPPDPAPEDQNGLRIERHRNCLPSFRLVGVYPSQPPYQIDLRPLQTRNVTAAQPRCQGKRHHVRQVLRQHGQQPLGLRSRQEPYTTSRLLQHPDLRGAVELLPFVDALPENRPQHLQHAVNRGIAYALGKFCIGNAVNEAAANYLQMLPTQEPIEPA